MRAVSVFAAVAALTLLQNTTCAEDVPDATLKLSGGSVAAGIGFTWAGGTLTYEGSTYEIEMSGLSVVDVGATKIEANGGIFRLKKLEDFDGNYTAATTAMTIAGGGSATVMENQNGVIVKIVATTQGLKFAFAASGVNMKIKK
jgi:hypothetical protein